jgi:N-glycosylase/DNA lyase
MKIQNERTLKTEWARVKPGITARLGDFREVWEKGREQAIFNELAFCLFTPQSKAKHCWEAVRSLEKCGLLHGGSPAQIAKVINKVRFRNNKAKYLVKARDTFFRNSGPSIKGFIKGLGSTFEAREWLVKNITGLGYKEASHFLRNIGLGEDIAILDRHILKNLKLHGVIPEIPKTLTPKVYLEIELKLREFSKKTRIPMDHLDLLFWQHQTGEIFK